MKQVLIASILSTSLMATASVAHNVAFSFDAGDIPDTQENYTLTADVVLACTDADCDFIPTETTVNVKNGEIDFIENIPGSGSNYPTIMNIVITDEEGNKVSINKLNSYTGNLRDFCSIDYSDAEISGSKKVFGLVKLTYNPRINSFECDTTNGYIWK